jgi:hypothetical protein
MKIPKPKKPLSIKPKRPFGLHAAFGNGAQAFHDPKAMVAPDQAFGAAMAMPQSGNSPAPAMPSPPEG